MQNYLSLTENLYQMETLHKHNFYLKWEYLKKSEYQKQITGEEYYTTTYIGHKIKSMSLQ